MNSEPPFNNDFPESSAEFDAETAEYFRHKVGTALVIALGLGVAAATLIHAFRPAPKPRQRIARLLEEMEDSLREAGAPAMNKVSSMATDGAHALSDRICRSEAQVEKFLRGAARRLRHLASAF